LIVAGRVASGTPVAQVGFAGRRLEGDHVMRRKGLFRTTLPGLGECARVDMSAGDAAPYLERDMYVMLGFQPSFEQLPEHAAAMTRGAPAAWPNRG